MPNYYQLPSGLSQQQQLDLAFQMSSDQQTAYWQQVGQSQQPGARAPAHQVALQCNAYSTGQHSRHLSCFQPEHAAQGHQDTSFTSALRSGQPAPPPRREAGQPQTTGHSRGHSWQRLAPAENAGLNSWDGRQTRPRSVSWGSQAPAQDCPDSRQHSSVEYSSQAGYWRPAACLVDECSSQGPRMQAAVELQASATSFPGFAPCCSRGTHGQQAPQHAVQSMFSFLPAPALPPAHLHPRQATQADLHQQAQHEYQVHIAQQQQQHAFEQHQQQLYLLQQQHQHQQQQAALHIHATANVVAQHHPAGHAVAAGTLCSQASYDPHKQSRSQQSMPSSAGSNESAYTAIESLPHLLDSPSTARASHDASVGPTGYLHDDEMATFGIWAEGSPGFAAPFQVTSAERLREPRRRKPPQLRSRTVRRSLDATFADAAATQPSCSAPRSPSSQHLADGDTCQGLATLREEAALHDDEAANSAASASGRCSPGNEGTSLGTSSQTSPSNASDATGAGRHCSRGVAASEPSDEAMASQASAETVHAANGPECNLAQALGGCRFLPLQESDARLVVGAMADGLAHMHDAGILHRDVGLGSVVLAASGALDTCRLLEGSHAAVMSLDCRFVDAGRVTQQAFAAPEICRSRTGSIVYTSAGDLWSLGVVLYTLLTGGQLPFGSCGPGRGFPGAPQAAASMDELQQWLDKHLQRLLAGNWTHQQWATAQGGQVAQQCVQPGPLSRPAQDLIRGLLRADPAQRPPALKVLGHPWTLALPEPIEPLQWGPDEQIPASYGPEEAHLTSTLSALQQLWVQPEHVVPGPSAREAHGAGASHADPGLTSLPGEKSGKKASSSMLGWFQKLLSRSGKRPGSGKGVGSDRDEEEPQDMMGVHHAHNW